MVETDLLPNGMRIKLNARYMGMHDEGYFLELDENGYAFVVVPTQNCDTEDEIGLLIYNGWLSLGNKQMIFHPIAPIDENATRVVHTVGKDNELVRELLNDFKEGLENAA